jgi:hypothetical protein
MSMVGGCAATRYGCCPDGKTSKVDNAGTNCPQGPVGTQREFDQILSGDVAITKLPKYKSIYKIEFSKKNISKVLLYQTWSSTSDDLNNSRVVTEIKATTWVKNSSKRSVATVPFQPTVVMELDNGQCPHHHKCKTCKKDADCKHVFVLIRAVVNKNDQVVFYASSKNIVLPLNSNQELKLLKEIPTGSFKHVRFDVDTNPTCDNFCF